MRKDTYCLSLNILFSRLAENEEVAALGKRFRSMGKAPKTEDFQEIYEQAFRLVEALLVKNGFKPDLLDLQQKLYLEMEELLAVNSTLVRHHFFIVIPVADRPLMLKNCIDSLRQQCSSFGYGGVMTRENGTSCYRKISVVILDDSSEEENIRLTQSLAAETEKSGIETFYLGLDNQTEILRSVPYDIRERLTGIIGEFDGVVHPHKGPSLSRNIAYLFLHALLEKSEEKALIYFLDSDEEFRIKASHENRTEDLHFINYFYWLDRIFSATGAEVLTGKVVGDPPVSPSVMICTFLEDLVQLLKSFSLSDPASCCPFHEIETVSSSSAEYHDHAGLFGYSPTHLPREYSCSLTGAHSVADCFRDIARKSLGFFYGLHPTRMQLYHHNGDFLNTEQGRTVYTGNYVFTKKGLRYFIPFANLRLRMAGPTLGRVLRAKLRERFVSANLPLLHRRTLTEKMISEFRPGIVKTEETLDLSGEFHRQFWGDVMLFSVELLSTSGYPVRFISFQEISEAVYRTRNRLWDLYKEKQTETEGKNATIMEYLSDPSSWWNQNPDFSRDVDNLLLCCRISEDNFGKNAEGFRKLAEQINEGSSAQGIIDAIHFYCEDDRLWNALLDAAPCPSIPCVHASGAQDLNTA